MADDLVNQLTLNFLISKNQLYKLNKKMKETNDVNKKNDRDIYKEQITILFNDLLENNPPNDLLLDVKSGFDYFVDKCIYYFKARNINVNQEEQKEEQEDDEQEQEDDEQEDDEQDEEQLQVEQDDEQEQDEEEQDEEQEQQVFVKEKHSKSTGYHDMQKLPLNWFQSVRQDYKQNHVISKKKDVIIGPNSPFRDEKKKI